MSLSAFNHVNVAAPPCVVYPVPPFNGWRKAVKLLTDTSDALDSYQFRLETVVLDRLMSKMRHTFKQHKHYKSIQRLSKCLKKIRSMGMSSVYSEFVSSFPEVDSGDFPSRQMLEYIVVKTLGLVELLLLSCDHCFRAIEYLWPLLQAGEFINSNVVNAACLSRLWVQCSLLAVTASSLYRELLRIIDYLKPSAVAWLPPDVRLPSDLDHLIASSSLTRVRGTAIKEKTESSLDKALSHFIVSCSEAKPEDNAHEDYKMNHEVSSFSAEAEDIGTLVQRPKNDGMEEFMPSTSKQPKVIISDQSDLEVVTLNSTTPAIADLKDELRKIRTGKQIIKWLKAKSQSNDAERVMTTVQWKGLKKCIRDTFTQSKDENKILTTMKQLVIKWMKQPRKCLCEYKTN